MGRRRRIELVNIATNSFDSVCNFAGVSRELSSQVRIIRSHRFASRSSFSTMLFFAANSLREYAAFASW